MIIYTSLYEDATSKYKFCDEYIKYISIPNVYNEMAMRGDFTYRYKSALLTMTLVL